MSILADRVMSDFPISIGTAMALRTLFNNTSIPAYDDTRTLPEHVDVSKYKYCFINISTLFRNMTGSIDGKELGTPKVKEYVDYIEQEMEVIESLFNNEGGNTCKPIFYFCTYKALLSKVDNKAVLLRVDNTERQKLYTAMLNNVQNALLSKKTNIIKFDSNITASDRCNILMISHNAVDLLSYKHFNTLHLLESHTGILKQKFQWSTKYVDGKTLPPLPFNRKLLIVFGDKEMFKPSLKALRDVVLEIAKKCKWTGVTTDDKVLMDLSLNMKDRFTFKVLQDF